jgi:hypothetical protein
VEVRDCEVADDDAGPQPRAEKRQRRDADADRRPERRDGAVQIGQLEPDLAGRVVRGRQDQDRQRVARGVVDPDRVLILYETAARVSP